MLILLFFNPDSKNGAADISLKFTLSFKCTQPNFVHDLICCKKCEKYCNMIVLAGSQCIVSYQIMLLNQIVPYSGNIFDIAKYWAFALEIEIMMYRVLHT